MARAIQKAITSCSIPFQGVLRRALWELTIPGLDAFNVLQSSGKDNNSRDQIKHPRGVDKLTQNDVVPISMILSTLGKLKKIKQLGKPIPENLLDELEVIAAAILPKAGEKKAMESARSVGPQSPK